MEEGPVQVKVELDPALSTSDDSSNEDDDSSGNEEENPYVMLDDFLNTEMGTKDVAVQGHNLLTDPNSDDGPKKRKRPRNPENWRRNKQKFLRSSGQPYLTYKNVLMPAKDYIPNYDCKCKKNCKTRFNNDELKKFHEEFWKLANYKLQNELLMDMITASEVKRRRGVNGSRKRKNFTLTYCIKITERSENVCKKYFLNVLRIGWGRVHRLFKKKNLCFDSETKNVSKKAFRLDIMEFINSFPTYQTQHSRRLNIKRRYINPKLSCHKMYELYAEKCLWENKILAKEKYFYGVYNRKFDFLQLKVPNLNTCLFCEALQLKIDSSENFEIRTKLLEQKNLHANYFEKDLNTLKIDTQKASEDLLVLSFDFQKPLPFPKLQQNSSLLKRSMFLQNLTFYNYNNKQNYFYFWDETEGRRSPSEISSTLLKHLHAHSENFTKIIIYATDYLKSLPLILTLLKLINSANLTKIKEINLKFMAPGHSFLQNTRDFEVIEKSSYKFDNIYCIEDWLMVFSSTPKKSLKPETFSMSHTDFLDVSPLLTFYNFQNLNLSKIRWVKLKRGVLNQYFYKETLSEVAPFCETTLSLSPEAEKGPPFSEVHQEVLYKTRRGVSLQKKADMLDLLELIPENYRDFYKNLPVSEMGAGENGWELGEDEVIYN